MSAPNAQSALPGPGPLRVLVAEDNATNQLLTTHLLVKRGHTVVVAPSGKDALAALSREAFDLVLMDVQMPEMTGIEATVAIRRAEAGTGRHLPIIALTAHAMKSDVEECLSAGMDAHLAKPIRRGTLLETIHAVLGWEAPAPSPEPPPRRAVDREALLASVDGDLELLRELVSLFPQEIPRQLADLRSSLARGDAPSLREAAHKLRGALGNFRANVAAEGARRLEQMGQAGDLADAAPVLQELTRELDGVAKALAEIVGAAP